MIILGVDPGTITTGYGIIRFYKNSCTKVASGTIRLAKLPALPEKLSAIYAGLEQLLQKYHPDEFSIETAFYGKNVQSALKIGYARGVAIVAAARNGAAVNEYSPREIKKTVTGNGGASKEQVAYMVRTYLALGTTPMPPDETDALAAALCHAYRFKAPRSKQGKDWKSFIDAFPERIIG